MVFDPMVIAGAIGRFLTSPRLAFGGLLATSFLAYLFRATDKRVLALPILFGGLLLYDLGSEVLKWCAKRRLGAEAELAKATAETERAARELEKRESAIGDLTRETMARLAVVRVGGVRRFRTQPGEGLDHELMTTPLVRCIGPKTLWSEPAEYEVEDWAWDQLADFVDRLSEKSPELFERLQGMAGRPWHRE